MSKIAFKSIVWSSGATNSWRLYLVRKMGQLIEPTFIYEEKGANLYRGTSQLDISYLRKKGVTELGFLSKRLFWIS